MNQPLSMNDIILMSGSGASALAGLSANLHAARSIRSQGRYLKGVANENAALNDLYARLVVKRGEEVVQERRRDGKKLIGRQVAAAAGQNLVVGEGTAGRLEEEVAADVADDVEAIRLNAVREAFGYKVEAANDRSSGRAAVIKSRGDAAQTAITGGLQFGRDLLYGASIYDRYGDRSGGGLSSQMLRGDPDQALSRMTPASSSPATLFRAGSGRAPRSTFRPPPGGRY